MPANSAETSSGSMSPMTSTGEMDCGAAPGAGVPPPAPPAASAASTTDSSSPQQRACSAGSNRCRISMRQA